jgi:hypothetical protein
MLKALKVEKKVSNYFSVSMKQNKKTMNFIQAAHNRTQQAIKAANRSEN